MFLINLNQQFGQLDQYYPISLRSSADRMKWLNIKQTMLVMLIENVK